MNTSLIESTRAQRFNFQVPLRYRVRGELKWHEGTTENISRSGLLFRGQHAIKPNTLVEISFDLSAQLSNRVAGEVIYSARIVRSVRPSGTVRVTALAARIDDYRLVRGEHERVTTV